MPNRYELARDWMAHPVISRALIHVLGYPENEPLPESFSLLNDSSEIRAVLAQIPRAYLAVGNQSILERKHHRTPARSIDPVELISELQQMPISEVGMSIRPRQYEFENEELIHQEWPQDIVLFLDIEMFDRTNPARVIVDQLSFFQQLEPVFTGISELFKEYGIAHTSVMTGRGYHFYFRVTGDSDAMRGLVHVGQNIEPSVLHKQATAQQYSKQEAPIPPAFEQAYKGATILQQYLARLIQKRLSDFQRESGISITFSDVGQFGVAIDNTSLGRHAGTGKVMVHPGFWLKPQVAPYKFGGESFVEQTPLITRLPRSHSDKGSEASIARMVEARLRFNKGISVVEDFEGNIPDASEAVEPLINMYLASDLYQLQQDLDRFNEIHPEADWPQTYRFYPGIKWDNPSLSHILDNPYPELLKPGALQYFINTLVDAGWSPIHIMGLLTALYTDPYIQWHDAFDRHDVKMRRAWGWVFIILSQAY